MKKMLIAGAIVLGLLATTGAVITKEPTSKLNALFEPIDTEISSYLAEESPAMSMEDFAGHMAAKYDRELTAIIKVLEGTTGQSLAEEDKDGLKLLIIQEHMHQVMLDNISTPEDATVVEIEPIEISTDAESCTYFTPMTSIPYPIYYWIQVRADVYGGSGYDSGGRYYNVNGGNRLYRVVAVYTSSWVRYYLYFLDEDHPYPPYDAYYDAWRLAYYGRIYTIETFYVQYGYTYINNIWDRGYTYAYWYPQHGSAVRYYRYWMYVSNVWNHAMDRYDRNPTMSKVTWIIYW